MTFSGIKVKCPEEVQKRLKIAKSFPYIIYLFSAAANAQPQTFSSHTHTYTHPSTLKPT